MKRLLPVVVLLALLAAGSARAVLQPGDIAILGQNADTPDEFAFVALTDIADGEVITFTDNGWTGTALANTEGSVTYTVSGGLARGTVVDITSVGSMALATSGDQILAYQGDASSPTFIYALNINGAGVWQAGAPDSNSSALPSGLVNGETAVAVNELDNVVFTNILATGTRCDWLLAIGNRLNWTGSDSALQVMPTGPFTVTAAACSFGPQTNLQFEGTAATLPENGGAYTVTVYKTVADGNVTAELGLAGTATLTDDFLLSSTSLVFNGATTAQTVVITMADDAVVESPETVTLFLTNIVGGGAGSPAAFTLTVTDSDVAPVAEPIVWVNEINYDPLGTDAGEFIEVAGAAGTDLAAYELQLYNGNGGTVYSNITLTGVLPDEGCGRGAISFAVTNFQNGAPDGVALAQIIAGVTSLVHFVGYEGSITGLGGVANAQIGPGIGTQDGNSLDTLQLAGTGTGLVDFIWATNAPSPGLLNVAQFITGCSGPSLTLAFSPAVATNAENGAAFDVLVYKSAADSNVTAQLVLGGTATQGVDYTISTTNITLSGATTAQVVTITMMDDGVSESNETVVLTFTNLTESVVGAPAQHTLVITDDDQLLLTITTATRTVQSDITVFDVGGTASANLVGELVWSNQLTGATGTTPAGTTWLVSGLPLGVGLNPVSVIGTNAAGGSVQALRNLFRLAEPLAGPAFILTQDFESTDTWAIVSGAAQVSTNVGVGDFPDSQRLANGTQSWQVSSANVTLELASVSIAGYTGRQVNVRVSSTALSGAQGADGGDHVRVFVALDGAAFSSTGELDLAGNSNARWGFTATNHAAIPAGTFVSIAAPQSGENVNNFSDLYVLIPDGATSLALRVQAQTDNASEIWNIDAIRVTGYGGVNPDADGDLMPDAWEQDNFGGSTTNEAAGDVDGDGVSNLDEYISGTSPTNGAAFLEVTAIASTPATVVSFFGATGRLYRLDYNEDLLNAAGWTEYTNGIPGTNGLMLVPRGDVTNGRTFRVRVQLP